MVGLPASFFGIFCLASPAAVTQSVSCTWDSGCLAGQAWHRVDWFCCISSNAGWCSMYGALQDCQDSSVFIVRVAEDVPVVVLKDPCNSYIDITLRKRAAHTKASAAVTVLQCPLQDTAADMPCTPCEVKMFEFVHRRVSSQLHCTELSQ